MFKSLDASRPLSRFGKELAIASTVLTALLSIADAIFRADAHTLEANPATTALYGTLAYDFRFLFEQLIYVGAIVFVGAKFFETRTILTVGFDKLDSDTMRLRGPDDDNVVWVGQHYRTRLEAEAMASALQSRMNVSAANSQGGVQ